MKVPHWVRGEERGEVLPGRPLALTALGGSVPTPAGGVTAEIVEAGSVEEVAAQTSRAVAVTHGTAIRVAATILLDTPVTTARHFAQDNAALNIFLRRGDRMVMKLWNDASHCTASDEGQLT